MDRLARQFVLDIIGRAKDMTLATVRPDGYPQATTVSYASEDLTLYVGIGKESQKAHNIHANHKVSLTINSDYKDWNQIKGISIGGVAEVLTEPKEVQHAIDCMIRRFPQLSEWEKTDRQHDLAFLKIVPEVISMLDYEKGFGHTELVTV